MKKTPLQTRHSEMWYGDVRNHGLHVRFDESGGCVGISQYDAVETLKDRVLLSPNQVRALLKFLGSRHSTDGAA